jgi:hypothetical protein
MADQKVSVILVSGELQVGTNVSKGAQEKVKWVNQTGQDGVTIVFANSPFEKNQVGPLSNGKSDDAGKLKAGAQAGTYKYTVKLAGVKDLDPNVIVDP